MYYIVINEKLVNYKHIFYRLQLFSMLLIVAVHSFPEPYCEKVDCGDLEDSSTKQARIVHFAKVLTFGKSIA